MSRVTPSTLVLPDGPVEPVPFPDRRSVLITGAASPRGIGRVTAHRLARSGWSVAVLDLEEAPSAALATELSDRYGVSALGVGASVTDEEQVDAALDRIGSVLPPLVGLVNIAGVSSSVPFFDVALTEWDRVFDINMRGAFVVTQRVAALMVEQRLGRIVSLSSVSAQRGGGTFSKVPYSAAKAALVGFTRAVAREISAFGVTLNTISPGPVDTDIMGGTLTPERKAELGRDAMVPRVGRPEEVAALIEFLLSEDAGYITAANYDINGGLYTS